MNAAEGGSLFDWFAEWSNHVLITKEELYHWPRAHTGATQRQIFLRQWKAVFAWQTANSLQAYIDFNVAGAPELEEGFIFNDQ